jgi:hypothetical protein
MSTPPGRGALNDQEAEPVANMQDERDRSALAREILLIQRQTHQIARMQFVQSRIWWTVNLIVGLPAAGIAAVAGGLALSGTSRAGLVGVLALVSAALGSFQTILGAQRRQANAERCGNAYLEIRNAARRFVTIDLPRMSYDDARRTLEELSRHQEEINRAADPPSFLAMRLGKKLAEESELHSRATFKGNIYATEERGD